MRRLIPVVVSACWLTASVARAEAEAEPVKMSMGVLAGLSIFFFGVYEMTQGFRAGAEERLKKVLARFTQNRLAGVLTGTLATAVLDSSSLVTIVTVGLVSAGLLTFVQALGVVLGANIGTTLSSQIIALGLTDYFGVVLALGAGLRFLSPRASHKVWGRALMGLGLVFLGLEEVESSMAPLKDSERFLSAMARLDNPLYGVLIGAAVTAVIQSSSATMGIVIVLAGQGALSLPAGVAIMMGAELGTCVDTLASTIGQSREAVRTGVFHLMFNVFNVALLVGFAERLAYVATLMTPGEGPEIVARQIANAHVLFNVAGVVVILPFLGHAARAMEWLIPSRPRESAEPRPVPAS